MIHDDAREVHVSDLEIFRVTCDMVTLYTSHPKYLAAFQAVWRAAIEAERAARGKRELSATAQDLISDVCDITGASWERCEAIAAEAIVAESRWTIRKELARIADLARRGAKLPDPPARIADAADELHHSIEAAQLRESSRQFERATARGRAG